MEGENIWESPDGKIKKKIIISGIYGKKPYENCTCLIKVIEGPPEIRNLSRLVIGHQDGEIGRNLDLCLITMNENEESVFTISGLTLKVCLQSFTQEKMIHQLSGKEKFDLSLLHKEKGVELYKNGQNKDAAYRFTKAIKILHSIPLDIKEPPKQIDGVTVEDIRKLKGTLYNNLSSCYFKNSNWLIVIDLCNKALTYDENNVKSLYKLGVSYKNDKNWEKSYKNLKKVMDLEPGNKACAEHLKFVLTKIKESEEKMKDLVKNMFKDVNK